MQHDNRASEFLKRPEINYQHLLMLDDLQLPQLSPAVSEQIEIQNKYAGYIDQQKIEVERASHYENLKLPMDLDYLQVSALSIEARQTLSKHRPETLGLASRIQGITPATISLLLVHLKKNLWRNTTPLKPTEQAEA